jgi:O-antigen/teichoic acid export membrane protein
MNKKIKIIFLKNFTSLSINQLVNILVTIIITPILFQNLGEASFGLVNLSFSIFMLLSIIICYGYHLNGPKKISLINQINQEKKLINELISLRIFLAVLTSLTIVFISYITNFFDGFRLIILFSLPILFSEAIHPVFYLQGKNKLSILAFLNSFSKLIYLGMIILFINNQNDDFKVNLIFGLSLFIVYLFFWIKIFFKNKIKFVWSRFDKIIYRLKENFEFFFSSIAGHISIHSSLIILKLFVDNIELGKFALANKIAVLLRMIPVFIFQSVLQNAAYINKENKIDLKNYLNYYYILGLIFTFIIGIFFTVFSEWIIIIFAGIEIDYSAKILALLSFIPCFAMLNFKNIMIILIDEKKRILNKATWISTLIMILISINLSYLFGGIGLAISLLLSEIASFIIHSILLSKLNESN